MALTQKSVSTTSSWSLNVRIRQLRTSRSQTRIPRLQRNDVEAEADLECATDVESAVLSASVSRIFTTTDELTSEITVTLEDEDGDAATPGDTVRFKTDNCEFEKPPADSDESTTVKGVTRLLESPWTARGRNLLGRYGHGQR